MALTIVLALVLMAALFGMIYAIAALIQSKKLMGTAPKDVQAAVQEHPQRFAGAHVLGWILLVFCLALYPLVFLVAARTGQAAGYNFRQHFRRNLSLLYAVKAFDIVCIDWFLLSKSHFFQHYYPETEGCAGYQQFAFNKREQLAQIAIFPVIARALAKIATTAAKKPQR